MLEGSAVAFGVRKPNQPRTELAFGDAEVTSLELHAVASKHVANAGVKECSGKSWCMQQAGV